MTLRSPALGGEIQHVSVARGPGICPPSGLCSTVVPAAREKLWLEVKATAAGWRSVSLSHVQCLHRFIHLYTRLTPCSASPCSPTSAAGSAPSLQLPRAGPLQARGWSPPADLLLSLSGLRGWGGPSCAPHFP